MLLGEQMAHPFDSCNTGGNIFSQLLNMDVLGNVCIDKYTQRF